MPLLAVFDTVQKIRLTFPLCLMQDNTGNERSTKRGNAGKRTVKKRTQTKEEDAKKKAYGQKKDKSKI